MLRLSRYLIKETLPLYLLGVAAFCLLLSIDKLVGWANWLIRYEVSFADVGRIMLYTLPEFLHTSLPVAVLFAILLGTGRLSKDSELKAAYSLGAKPLRLLAPFLLIGLLVSGITLFNNGWLEPLSTERHDDLVNTFLYTLPPAENQTNVAYRNDDGTIYFAGKISADTEDANLAQLSGILVLEADGSTITAPSGEWDSAERVWTLFEPQTINPAGKSNNERELSIAFDAESDAATSLADKDTLTLGALAERLNEVKTAGGELRVLRHNFHVRIADAFSALVFALIAGILGLQLHGRVAGFGWMIALIVVFWALWGLSNSFFDQRVLPPVIAAWFTTGIVGTAGLIVAWWRLR